MSTFARAAAGLLDRLCKGLDVENDRAEFQEVQDFFLQGWGTQEIPRRPPYASTIGDDHSPFEYSVAFGQERTELRLLVEMQGQTPAALTNQQAALAFNARLAQRF